MTSLDSSTIGAAYLPINTGLPQALSVLRIINASNTPITISYNGVQDHDYVAANTPFQLPNQSNSMPNNNMGLIPKGTIIYAKGTAGVGFIYLAGYYQPQGA